MAGRPPDPKDVRVSMVDKGWSEAPPAVRDLTPPPPPLPKKKPDVPPPPPLPGQAGPPSSQRTADEITRDETPDITELEDSEPPAPTLPRELPPYEDSPRDLLVTRVDDQMQARANAMTAMPEEPGGEKTAVGPPPSSHPPVTKPARSEPFPESRSSPTATAGGPPPPPPLPGTALSSAAATTPTAPRTFAAPVVVPSLQAQPPKQQLPKGEAFPPKVRTAAWPIPQQVIPPVAPVAAAPAAPVAPAQAAPVPPVAPAPAIPARPTPEPLGSTSTVPAMNSPFSSPGPLSSVPNSITMVDEPPPNGTLRDALLGRVRIANRPVPLWLVLAPVFVLTAMLAALIVGIAGATKTAASDTTAAPSASADPGEPERAAAPAPGNTRKPTTLLERAAAGEPTALSALEQKKPNELGTDEALAIAQGKVAQDVAAAKKLRERLSADPGLAKDKKIIADLLRFAHGRETGHDALATMAALPGPLSADLVYEVWTGTAERSDATELARAILLGKDVRPKASPALGIALDLREATTCEQNLALLERAIEQGDKRALVPINRLARRTGCGANKKQDCFPCLRDGDLLKRAFNAVRVRREPELLR